MNQKPPAIDNKNFLLAMVLSALIIFGWQYFYVAPQAEKAKAIAEQQQKLQVPQGQDATAAAGATPAAGAVGAPIARDIALTKTARVKIDTPDVDGTINLKGAALDDLKLKRYRETVDPRSPEIVLLSPNGTKDAYFVEHYVVPAAGSNVKVPTPDTLWSAPEGVVLGAEKPVVLSWNNGDGVTFRREFSIDDQYVIAVKQTVENKSQQAFSFMPYARVQRQGTPKIEGFYVFFEGLLGVQNGELQEINYTDVKKDGAVKTEGTGGWLGFTDKYWATALIPDQTKAVTSNYQYTNQNGVDVYQVDYQSRDSILVPAGGAVSYQDHLFAGAKVFAQIDAVKTKHGIDNFDLMIDWGWFKFLTKPMFYLLSWVKSLVGNFGVAILLVTVLVKLAVFPLANKSYASMSKMKKLQPEMERLKKEFGDDRAGMQKELMELYKKEKVSPVSGCLPIVVQIPVFFALYKVILTSIELRHAPFYGWIKDLSVADPSHLFNLFGLIPWTPPTFLAIGILPILMGITMWVQMRLNPAPADPIQASMFNWMPLIFTFMMASFPAGLVIYWTWSNLLSIIQQSYIMKKNGVEVDLFGNIKDSIPFLKKKTAT
jgi:YidC/Oxa1 family membrane protein insertase